MCARLGMKYKLLLPGANEKTPPLPVEEDEEQRIMVAGRALGNWLNKLRDTYRPITKKKGSTGKKK